MNSYAKDLIPIIRKTCRAKESRKYDHSPPLPANRIILALLDVAYHASCETEEGRRPGFRLILYSPNQHKSTVDRGHRKARYYDPQPRLLLLDQERPYTVAEVNRLAPAAEFRRFLICIRDRETEKEPSLSIWALLDMGENWWKFVHHETSGGRPPPNFLTVTSTGPGEISVSAQGDVLASLKAGQITLPSTGALWHVPLNDFFDTAKKHLYKDAISRLGTKRWADKGHDDDWPYRFYNIFVERILFYTRLRAHGGTILVIPHYIQKDDTRLTDRIHIKYPSQYSYAWDLLLRSLVNHRKFFDLHFPLWEAKIEYTKELFQEHSMLHGEKSELDEALGDVSQAIASLTSVDGAVLMTDHFDILGFGAEVVALSSSLSHVHKLTGPKKSVAVPVDSFGTRHRSAFRFCSSLEEAVAFIVSQDGGVKAVKRVGKDVILWPDINAGAMGI